MANEELNEELFDTILKRALRDVVIEEQAALDEEIKASGVTYTPSAKHLREARREWKKYQPKKKKEWTLPAWSFRALTTVCALFVAVFVTLFTMPDVRAAVLDSVVEFYDKYIAVHFDSSEEKGVKVGEFTMGYVPKGYMLVEKNETETLFRYKFYHDSGKTIILEYQKGELLSPQFDVEHTETRTIYISDFEVLFCATGAVKIAAMWQNDGFCFNLLGDLSEIELKKIIYNIS